MSILTGRDGEMRFQGVRIAKCREFSIDVERDALDCSVLGSNDREYTEGMRGATGSTTVLYDEEDPGTIDLVNSIFSDRRGGQQIGLILNTSTNRGLSFRAMTTRVGTPVRVGDVTACSVSFQVTGPFDGGF